jgi:aminomethyltransferase
MSDAPQRDLSAVVAAVRRGAGLFVLENRGLVEVTGEDRGRWLNGMLSNDVEALGDERPGCYALRLDRKGRILADVHVWRRSDAFWLETAAPAVTPLVEDLDRFIIADDVELADRSDAFDRLGVEGPGAPALVSAWLGTDVALSDDAWLEFAWEGRDGVLAAFGWSGEAALQLFVPKGSGGEVVAALEAAAARTGVEVVRGTPEALEVLRVESGTPAWGAELDLEVFPDEARLARAVSTTKGCYTGQEIVARLRSRGQVNHLLVGLAFDSEAPPAAGTELFAGDKRTGEVTSSVRSPALGAIGLGYARREHAEPGSELAWEGGGARVVALPMVSAAVTSAGVVV